MTGEESDVSVATQSTTRSVPWWLRVLIAAVAAWLEIGDARTALAQAPSPSFYDDKTEEDLRALASNPRNDILLRRGAATRLVILLADRGRLDEADAACREFAKTIEPRAPLYVRGLRRRATAHTMAVSCLAAVLGIAAASILGAYRRAKAALSLLRPIAPMAAGFTLFSGLAGGWFASNYEDGTPLPFWVFASAVFPLLLVFRLWSAVGSSSGVARLGRAAAAAAATLAVGFLSVEYVNASFLGGFGL